MDLRRLGLVQPGEAAVVPLVQPPVLGLGNPGLTRRVQRQPQGPYGAGQHRGEGAVELHACLGDQFAAATGFCLAGRGQVDVHPAGEAVLEIPLALAVAEQDECWHGRAAKVCGR